MVGQAQLSWIAAKNFNYSNMLVVKFNLSVRIPLSTFGINMHAKQFRHAWFLPLRIFLKWNSSPWIFICIGEISS